MSVYKVKESPYYHMDFVWRGHRIHRTTKCTSRREAEQVEREALEQAKKRITNQQAASTSLLLDHIIDRYWLEVGQHHVNANSTWKDLSRLIDYFGKDKLLNEIGDDDVARLVAWRRGHRVVHNKKTKPEDCPLISPATVNRTTTEVLKKLFTCAKTKWGLKFDREPNWRVHLLREPEERVRELVGDEGDRLEAATPEDYRAFFEFVRASGLRRKECVLLRWSEINWQTGQIVKFGKGGRRITCPITPTIRAILAPLEGHHSEFVFTRVAKRSYKGEVRGRRYPLTLWGVNIAWKRLRKRAGVTGFRFHDFRHDFASRLLRKTGNLKIVQKALNHADIKTTTRYAHVLDSEVGIAMEEVSRDRRNSAENSPNKSPRLDRKVG